MQAEAGQRQRAVVVHGPAEARAALALAPGWGVLLVSAPAAAGYLGAPWFLALVAAAAAAEPGVPHRAMLDCGDAPGLALAGLRDGARLLVLDGACPAFPQVAGAAAALGAELWPRRPPALDLAGIDLRRPGGLRLLTDWLAAPG